MIVEENESLIVKGSFLAEFPSHAFISSCLSFWILLKSVMSLSPTIRRYTKLEVTSFGVERYWFCDQHRATPYFSRSLYVPVSNQDLCRNSIACRNLLTSSSERKSSSKLR